jgi:hypothetical protein
MQRGVAGSLIAISLALTACADQQGWLGQSSYMPAYGAGYGYTPYPLVVA